MDSVKHLLSLYEEYERLTHARRLFASASFTHESGEHDCSADCDYVQDGDVFVCKSSCNLHICSDIGCDACVETQESMVCVITGLCYPLDFLRATVAQVDEDGEKKPELPGYSIEKFDKKERCAIEDAQVERANKEALQKLKDSGKIADGGDLKQQAEQVVRTSYMANMTSTSKKHHKRKRQETVDGDPTTTTTHRRVRPKLLKRERTKEFDPTVSASDLLTQRIPKEFKARDIFEIRRQVNSICAALFASPARTKIDGVKWEAPDALLGEISLQCARLWTVIIKTKIYATNANSFKVEYLILYLLFAVFSIGLTIEGVISVPENKALREYIPMIKHLGKLLDPVHPDAFRGKAYMKCCSRIKECLFSIQSNPEALQFLRANDKRRN